MLLLYVITVWSVLFGGSSAEVYQRSECYGQFVRFPYTYTPPHFKGQLYFTPKKGGSRKLVMDKDEAKDPRLQISIGSVVLTDLTERDEGMFSVSFANAMPYDIINLEIMDCANEAYKKYGTSYGTVIPGKTEYIEFLHFHSKDLPIVLWNLSDPQANNGSRWRMRGLIWEITYLTYADGGYYNFRNKDKTVLTRERIVVSVDDRRYRTKVKTQFVIEIPPGDATWTVTFTSAGGDKKSTLMEAGNLVTDNRRIRTTPEGIEINPVNTSDSGTFEFRDQRGVLVKTVELVVEDEPLPVLKPYVYFAITGGIIFAMVVCCCCVKKCCCKKSSSKMDKSAPHTASAPALYYHDLIQPEGPSYSAAPAPNNSYQPMNSVVSGEHTPTPLEPSVESLGEQGGDPAPTLGSDCCSSDPVPMFELKRQSIPSALPLSSDSTSCDVYTSDKLNFNFL